MEIKCVKSGTLGVNTYFITENGSTAVIDTGEDYFAIKEFARKEGLKITRAYYTHAHFDHLGNAARFQKDGVKIYLPLKDIPLVEGDGNLGVMYTGKFEKFLPDFTLKEGDFVDIGGGATVMETPGHTQGSVCYVGDGFIFSGDTLFLKCVGRTDLPSSNHEDLVKSVQRLYSLKGDYTVYPGHGKFTTLSFERENNLFIKEKNGEVRKS